MLRSWYSRLPLIVQNVHQLVANSEECASACSDGEMFNTTRFIVTDSCSHQTEEEELRISFLHLTLFLYEVKTNRKNPSLISEP